MEAHVNTRIREARESDAPELAALSTDLGYPSSTDDIRRRLPFLLSNPEHKVLVATDDADRAIACLHANLPRQLVNDRFVEIASLVVADGCRGSGIGARLLEEAERWGTMQGAEAIRVRSNVIREQAHRFYLRAGYTLAKTSYVFTKPARAE